MVDALLKTGPLRDAARRGLRRFAESELPVYAIKEFKAGALRAYVWLHNKFATERSYARTLTAVHAMSRTLQRNLTSTAIEALATLASSTGPTEARTLEERYGSTAKLDTIQCDESRLALKAIIYKAWSARRSITTRVVCPLSCYEELENVQEGRSGTLEIGRLGCTLGDECCLRASLVERLSDIEALRNAAREQGSGREHSRRYQTLREIHRKPGRPLGRDECRHLGDAVFAFFAPSDATILTTNVKDHEPLANALGKVVQRP